MLLGLYWCNKLIIDIEGSPKSNEWTYFVVFPKQRGQRAEDRMEDIKSEYSEYLTIIAFSKEPDATHFAAVIYILLLSNKYRPSME